MYGTCLRNVCLYFTVSCACEWYMYDVVHVHVVYIHVLHVHKCMYCMFICVYMCTWCTGISLFVKFVIHFTPPTCVHVGLIHNHTYMTHMTCMTCRSLLTRVLLYASGSPAASLQLNVLLRCQCNWQERPRWHSGTDSTTWLLSSRFFFALHDRCWPHVLLAATILLL